MRYPLPWFPLSEGTSRCSCRTTRGYRPYRSSFLGCRFGRSGSSRFVGGFRPRHWCGCVPVPRVRSCRDRYICSPRRLLGRGGCRPKRIQFPLRGRLKLSEKRKPRTCPTSGLEVSYGLRIANFGSIPDILLYQK